MENIILKQAQVGEDFDIIIDLMNNADGIKEVFRGRTDRLITSPYSFLIQHEDEVIGFLNLVIEKNNENFLFLDAGIIKEYRSKGIGKLVLCEIKELLEENDIDTYVLIETEQKNIGANKSANEVGCYLMEIRDRNIYLLQKERIEEFVDNDYFEKLTDHYDKPNKKNMMI